MDYGGIVKRKSLKSLALRLLDGKSVSRYSTTSHFRAADAANEASEITRDSFRELSFELLALWQERGGKTASLEKRGGKEVDDD